MVSDRFIPMPRTPEEWEALADAAYDEGYDDALEGLPRRNAGDLQPDYDAGYSDGESEESGGFYVDDDDYHHGNDIDYYLYYEGSDQ